MMYTNLAWDSLLGDALFSKQKYSLLGTTTLLRQFGPSFTLSMDLDMLIWKQMQTAAQTHCLPSGVGTYWKEAVALLGSAAAAGNTSVIWQQPHLILLALFCTWSIMDCSSGDPEHQKRDVVFSQWVCQVCKNSMQQRISHCWILVPLRDQKWQGCPIWFACSLEHLNISICSCAMGTMSVVVVKLASIIVFQLAIRLCLVPLSKCVTKHGIVLLWNWHENALFG